MNHATKQLPDSARAGEAETMQQRLKETQGRRRPGPQPLADLILVVLAGLGVGRLQSEAREDGDPG
jgi:hypothetical protein